MLAQNFSWSDSIHLKTQDFELDLHNCYDFQGIRYDVVNRSIQLDWRRGTGAWVDEVLPEKVFIDMVEVDYLRIEPRDPELPFTEDGCLSSFGYNCEAEWAVDQFWPAGPPEPHWRWSFEFQSEAKIIVGGKSASVTIEI